MDDQKQRNNKKKLKRFQKHTRNKLKIYALLSKDGCERNSKSLEEFLLFSNKMKELEIKTTENNKKNKKKVYLKTFAV